MDTSAISEHIITTLKDAGRPLLGTQLSEAIKLRFPDFRPVQFGTVKLRDFIREYAKGAYEVGRSGGDFLYSTDSSAAVPANTTSSISPHKGNLAVWRTYASPKSLYTLYVEPASGEFRVGKPGGPLLPEPWKLVPPCSPTRHKEIARDFIGRLPESIQPQLTAFLDGPDWWIAFFEHVKALGLTIQWSQYRHEKIIGELSRTLTEMGASTARLSDLAFHPPTVEDQRPASGTPSRTNLGLAKHASNEAELQRIAAALIARMSTHELRALSVRLGDVLDILGF